MKLVEMTVNTYLDVLKSDAPAPGGGSVSALSGAQGIGLALMVCDLTLGKEKYADYQAVCEEAKEKGISVYIRLVEAIDKDTEAFNLVSAAFKMPKETDEEKAARKQAIADGTLVATQVPFETMEIAFEGLKIVETLEGKSNPNASSDLGVAALNLMSAIRGAWLNVKINLPGVKDEEAAKAFVEKGEAIIAEAEKLAAPIYERVLASL